MKKKPAAKKRVTKKSPAKRVAAKKSAAKKPAAKKRSGKKLATTAATAKKSVAKKSTAKKLVKKKAVAKKAAPKKRKTKKPPASNGTSKAQSIRDAAKELGKKARPRDIIAALAAEGITVSSALVSMTLKAAGLRRGRRRRKGAAMVPIKASGNGQGHTLNLDHLLQVKELAAKIGGTDKLKEVFGALERLI